MAIDEDVDAIRAYLRDETDGVDLPILVDADHLVTELYAISNVPTVVWIDEAGTIVQPNWNAFSTDTFRDFTGIDSGAQVEAIRRWVIDGELMMTPEEARDAVGDLSDAEERARLHFRLANRLRHDGDDEAAERHYALAEEHRAAGRPYHGVAAAGRR